MNAEYSRSEILTQEILIQSSALPFGKGSASLVSLFESYQRVVHAISMDTVTHFLQDRSLISFR
jgi:hypothetical protein